MHLRIDNKNGRPIYDQIYTQLKDMIMNDTLPSGTGLPSIRVLAKDLRISVITTKHAYDALEQEGYIYTVPGKGCFVAEKNMELIREENLRKMEEHFLEIRRLAAICAMSEKETEEMMHIIWENQDE